MSALLKLEAITAAYGRAQALFGVSLGIGAGEALALLGRNGMGKSTTIRVICRMMRESGGRLSFAGHDLASLPSHRAARLGIGLVPEGRRVFAGLSVEENLIAAARPGHWDQARIEALFPRLAERRRQRAATLSGGEQQMLAIGRALMTNPRLLILDEATEGLAPVVRAEIWAALTALRGASEMALLIVDKSLPELRRIARRAVILEKGRSVWAGAMEEITPAIAQRHLGL